MSHIRGGTLLAPMLGATDIPFRNICAEYGAALTCTEMVSARGIADCSSFSFRNAAFDSAGHPVAIQLVAASPENAVEAITHLQSLRPAAFDINAGCPNDRICSAGAGAGLLDDLPRFAAVIAAAANASPVPVSVKIRAGSPQKGISVVQLARAAEEEGAAWITIHARVPEMPYEDAATPQFIADAKAAVRIPVVGNGDVFCAADAIRLQQDTGCDAVMVARGSLGSPWIFRDILRRDTSGALPPLDEVRLLIQKHMQAILREYGPVNALPRMRKHALWYGRHYRDVDSLRSSLFSGENSVRLLEAIARHFDAEPEQLAMDDPVRQEVESRFRRRVLYWTQPATFISG